jgi:hypothetical protein
MSEQEEVRSEEEVRAEETKVGVDALIKGMDYYIEDGKEEETPAEETPAPEAEVEVEAEAEIEEKPEEKKEETPDPMAAMQAQIEALSAKLNEKESEKTEEVAEEEATDITPVPSIAITADEVEEAQLDSEKMLALLQKVAAQTAETVLQSLPSVVSTTVTRQTTIADTVKKFWDDNPKLEGSKEFVKFLIRQVEGEHPDWGNDYGKILDEVAQRAYKMSIFEADAREAEQERREEKSEEDETPAGSSFARKPRGSNRRPAADTRTEDRKKLDAMLAGQ